MSSGPETTPDDPGIRIDLVAEVAALRAKSDAPCRQKLLHKSDGRSLVLLALDDGAGLSDHRAPGPISIQTLDGEISVSVGDVTHVLPAGHVLALASGVVHAVRAHGESAFLLQIALTA